MVLPIIINISGQLHINATCYIMQPCSHTENHIIFKKENEIRYVRYVKLVQLVALHFSQIFEFRSPPLINSPINNLLKAKIFY